MYLSTYERGALTKEDKMKTLATMFAVGTIYTASAIAIAEALGGGVSSDSKFALFVIGMVAGVFTSKSLGWID
jgi:hypothetical protein